MFIYLFIYFIVLVLPYIDMNQPWVYMCSPSWTPLPPLSPPHPSGSSQGTSPNMFSSSVVSDFLWPHGYSLPDSSVHGIFQARTLQEYWSRLSFSTPEGLPNPDILCWLASDQASSQYKAVFVQSWNYLHSGLSQKKFAYLWFRRWSLLCQ